MAQSSDEVIRDPAGTVHPSMSTAPPLGPTTDELRSQIEATRVQMSNTIDAIQDRLSPGRLMTQAKESVKQSTVGQVKRLAQRASTKAGDIGGQVSHVPADVLQGMKNNPVPVALVGVGVTGLVLRALTRRWAQANMRSIDQAEGPVWPETPHPTGTVRNNVRLLAAAAAGVACWAIWNARTSRSELLEAEQRA